MSTVREKVNTWLQDSERSASSCVQRMSGVKNSNLSDACDNLDEASGTIWYTFHLVNAYFVSAGSPDPWIAYIRDACNRSSTGSTMDCEDDMFLAMPKGGADMTETTLAYLAVNVSIQKAESYVSFMNGVISGKTAPQGDKQLAMKCVGEIHTALVPLNKLPVRNPQYLGNLKGFLEGLAAAQTDCQHQATQFEHFPLEKVDPANHAVESTNIAIKMVGDYLKNKGPGS